MRKISVIRPLYNGVDMKFMVIDFTTSPVEHVGSFYISPAKSMVHELVRSIIAEETYKIMVDKYGEDIEYQLTKDFYL